MGKYWEFPRLFKDGYDSNIGVRRSDRDALAAARETMRAHLRAEFAELRRLKSANPLLVETARASLRAADSAGFLAPKFRIQGSMAYHTAIDALQHPPQEIDMDDGMFLPASFFSGDGNQPVISAEAYHDRVAASLERLALRKKGWRVVPKDTCVRMQINQRLHVDLPLYAVREEAFQSLVEKVLNFATASVRDSYQHTLEFDAATYGGIAAEDMRLAHRKKGWISSDPRKLEDWFVEKASAAYYGENVRRTVRIIKAYRDTLEGKSSLSSLAIMVGVVDAFDANPGLNQHKLCTIVATACEHMSQAFARPVMNPVFPDDADSALCIGWSDEDRRRHRQNLLALKRLIDRAGSVTEKDLAHRILKGALTLRLSDDVNLIDASDAVVDGILGAVAAQQPAPRVASTTSG